MKDYASGEILCKFILLVPSIAEHTAIVTHFYATRSKC